MQSDTRLVEDIEHVDQLTADLGCQTDTLAFPTGKACRSTVERQVIQSHIQQELQAGTYLLQYFYGNLFLLLVQTLLDTVQPFVKLGNIIRRYLCYILSRNAVVQRLFVQTLAVTFRACSHFDELSRPFLCGSRSLALLLHQDIFGNTFVRQEIIGRTQRFVLDLETFVRPIHDLIDRLCRDIFDRRLDRHAVLFAKSLDLPEDKGVLVFTQSNYPTVINTKGRVGYDLFHIQ